MWCTRSISTTIFYFRVYIYIFNLTLKGLQNKIIKYFLFVGLGGHSESFAVCRLFCGARDGQATFLSAILSKHYRLFTEVVSAS